MNPRFFKIKAGIPFAGRKMKFVRMSPYEKGNFILALLSKDNGVVVQWVKGDTFEFSPDEVKEIKA